MPNSTLPRQKDFPTVHGRLGVVDIGSNTVRLVVYDVPDRLPVPMFNEKSECRLVEGLSSTGHLSKTGVKRAIRSIGRFVRLAQSMGVESLDLVATAAVREASDGADFVKIVEKTYGTPVTILSGAEEAELAALGLIVGVPDADGVLGDLGGGSLDLVVLDKGRLAAFGTLPLGHVLLREMADNKIKRGKAIVEKHLKTAKLLKGASGKKMYLAGGIVRTIARIFIEQTNYPLHIVDNYALRADDALRLSRLLAGLSQGTLKKIPIITPNRIKSIPFAAEVLASLIEAAKPKQVVFSGFGMREGQMLKRLPEDIRHQDPLIAGALTLAENSGRFALKGQEIVDWVRPIFPNLTPTEQRRIEVACLLSDIAWNEHPDYRAEHAFYRCLRLPYAGLSHPDRVATSVYVRYNGDPNASLVNSVRGLLAPEDLAKVEGIGRAIRLAHTVSGSAPGLLAATRMERSGKRLILHLPGSTEIFRSETVDRRFRSLARILGLQGNVSRR
ncbi:MAG: Ppx/GppA phosphatase family protein [Proteobacteria bacterium]|nr:Ppx/GppA phosphatase family protein [Pseudomonadota bacterium]